MKFGIREVLELSIFNEKGEFVTFLDTLKNSGIYTVEGITYVVIGDALFDSDLIKFLGRIEENTLTDYEKEVNKVQEKTTVVFNSDEYKSCRLIAYGILRKQSDASDHEFTYEIPKALILTDSDIDFASVGDPSVNRIVFQIEPYNDLGDLYKMRF